MMVSPRADVVVANRNRTETFIESLENLKGFSRDRDRMIIMDCSGDSRLEHKKLLNFFETSDFGGQGPIDLRFFGRKSWGFDHGARLDYLSLLNRRTLDIPRLTFFMQDHYLNQDSYVNSDTLPAGQSIDLNLCGDLLDLDNRQVLFNSRYGFRISASNPSLDPLFSNMSMQSGSQNVSFLIDGTNMILDPTYLLNYFAENPEMLISGDGTYAFAVAWETRISKILYDQGLTFTELSRGISVNSIEKLLASYPLPCETWCFYYHLPTAFEIYGKDIYRYPGQWKWYWHPRVIGERLKRFLNPIDRTVVELYN
jgi:hypothetical protein